MRATSTRLLLNYFPRLWGRRKASTCSSSRRWRSGGSLHRAIPRPVPYSAARRSGGARRKAAEDALDDSSFPSFDVNSRDTAAADAPVRDSPPAPAAGTTSVPAPDGDADAGGEDEQVQDAAPETSSVPAANAATAAAVGEGDQMQDDAAAETSSVPAADAANTAAVGGGEQMQDAAADTSSVPAADAATAVAAGGGGQMQDGEWFRVSDSVRLALHRGDITKWFVDGETDAIVNAANSRMLGGGGVDGAIHRKAGRKLLKACREIPEVSRGVRCPVGEARITPGFKLPVSRVIHAVGPIYHQYENPAGLLGKAYRNSLNLAIKEGIKYIAFPAISCGVYSYPFDKAAIISLSVIKEASNGLSEVHFFLFEMETYSAWMEEASKQFEKML